MAPQVKRRPIQRGEGILLYMLQIHQTHSVPVAVGQDCLVLMSIRYREVGVGKRVVGVIHKTNSLLGPPR